MQITLTNIKTELCPMCKLAMQPYTIYGDTVLFWCPNCVKEFEYTVCLKCGTLYKKNIYKICADCREKYRFLEEE